MIRHTQTASLPSVINSMVNSMMSYDQPYKSPFEWGITTPFSQYSIVKPSVDVKEDEEHITVKIDVPGIEKNNIKVRLLDPKTLEVICEQNNIVEDKNESYFVRERSYGYMKRTVSLPKDVTELDVKTKFENGVLTLIFNKILVEKKGYIQLE